MSICTTERNGGVCCVCRYAISCVQSPGCWPSSAESTYIQNNTESLSPSSRDTQAIRGRSGGSDGIQVERSVVLPKPAGAETSVSGHSKLILSNSIKRGRGISACEEEGIKNFVARSWSWNNDDSSMKVSLAYVALLLSYVPPSTILGYTDPFRQLNF